MAADPVTGYDPDDDMDLQEANARFAAAGDQHKAQEAQDAFTKAAPPKDQPSGLQHWFTNLPQNVGSGLINAAINTADTLHSGLKWMDRKAMEGHAAMGGEPADFQQMKDEAEPLDTPEYGAVRNAVQNFNQKYIAVKNPDVSDSITQGVAQFAIPFMGWSKAVSAVGNAGKLAGMGRALLAESATAGTAMAPHDGRFADMVELGRHTEGKFADALNAITPDGSALNTYLSYMTDHTNESEWEGRMKNIVDTVTGSAVISPLIHAGMTMLKGGMSGLKYAMENGVGSVDQLAVPNQAGKIGYHGTPHDFNVDAGFDNSKIGTGEGNQVYGYGHYLAESPGTGKHYQTTLVDRKLDIDDSALGRAKRTVIGFGGDKQKAFADITKNANAAIDPNERSVLQKAAQLVKSGATDRGNGSFITADVPDEHIANMIDHDKPLAEQPRIVRDAFAAHGINGDSDMSGDMTGGNAYKLLADKFEEVMPGRGPQAASALLDMRGVPGVKYLDGNSRGTGEGTRNLVVFNGKNIKVIAKNGVPVTPPAESVMPESPSAKAPRSTPDTPLTLAALAGAGAVTSSAQAADKPAAIPPEASMTAKENIKPGMIGGAYVTKSHTGQFYVGGTAVSKETVQFYIDRQKRAIAENEKIAKESPEIGQMMKKIMDDLHAQVENAEKVRDSK